MSIILIVAVTFFAGMGAGLGTGFAGMSAAAVISPMLITFLDIDPYMAVGIALSSDVLASAVSAYTYHKNKNLDIKKGLITMVSVLVFPVVGSYVAHQGGHGGGVRPKTGDPVCALRRFDRIYLRLHRRGRRHDDAPDPHQRHGL